MAQLDIKIEGSLQEALNLPPCEEIKLNLPSPLKVTLPTGGSIKALSDLSKGFPTDCGMTINLMLQIAPLLASMECLLKILKLIKPLIDVINGLPVPPVKALLDFGKAAEELVPCLLVPTPLSILPFLKDLLCLILKALKCFLSQMKTLIGFLSGIKLSLQAAQADNNSELMASLQCAQDNAMTQAQGLSQSLDPIFTVLQLMSAIFAIAGKQPPQLPTLGAPPVDVEGLNTLVQSIQGVVGTLQVIADALGGCDA
jgi:hypothetical protein